MNLQVGRESGVRKAPTKENTRGLNKEHEQESVGRSLGSQKPRQTSS